MCRRTFELAHVEGEAKDILKDGGDCRISSNAIVLRRDSDWSLCTIYSACGDRYVTVLVKSSALNLLKHRASHGRPDYFRALAAAEDMSACGIGTINMAVAFHIDRAITALKSKLKSKGACTKADCAAPRLYNIAEDLCEDHDATPKEAAAAVVNCYVENDMDAEAVESDMESGELFNYL